MPSFYPENNTGQWTDDNQRSLAKRCSALIATKGNQTSQFPEGCQPGPLDSEEILAAKLAILEAA